MPIIKPPSDIYLPVYDEVIPMDQSEYERIKEFLNVPNWKCPCGATNFGRNKFCPACMRVRDAP